MATNLFTRRWCCGLCVLAALVSSQTVQTACAAVDARLLRHPDVSASQVAFVYAGDIWVVGKAGGLAQRLSSPPGEESAPKFSPDGRKLAFTGNYDGNQDIYVIDVAGGTPARLTHHPGSDRVLDWYPDGQSILMASRMESGSPAFSQLYKLPAQGGLPEKLPIAFAAMAALSPDGEWVAFTLMGRQETWKRYRGGTAPDIWLFNLKTLESRNVTDNPATDESPMWHGRTLYFLSDRGDVPRFNIWALSVDDRKVRQVTHFTDVDVHYPSIGPEEIVFEAGGRLHLLSLQSGEHKPMDIQVVTDLAGVKPQDKNVGKQAGNPAISPAGKRVLFEARGEIFSVPAEHGPVLNLTRSSGVAERFPAWSPDGKRVAYWTDRTGEYELAVRSNDVSGSETVLTSLGPGYRYRLFWSPDSRKLAFADQQLKIWILDTEDKSRVEVHQLQWLYHNSLQSYRVMWSPDSRWLTYSAMLDNANEAIFLFDTKNRVNHRITSGFYSDRSPVFDPEGKYLYCQSDRDMRPVYGRIDPDMWTYPNATRIGAFALRADVPSPLAARDDTDEQAKKEEKKEGKESKADSGKTGAAAKEGKESSEPKETKDGKPKAPAPVEIDLEGLERRFVILPPPAGNYSDVQAVAGKVIYTTRSRLGDREWRLPDSRHPARSALGSRGALAVG